ncbi:MAG: hypothetical protein JO046_04970 [Solirubrobacterales bacterium]|nr:hypothetical protein [Solirubrobacterales bacterium]
MKPSLRQLPVCALAAIALAACGSSSNNGTVPSLGRGTQTQAAAPSGTDSLAAWRAAVACARRHGMPWIRDPVLDAKGHPGIPGGTPTPTPAVVSACGAQVHAIRGSLTGNPIESASDIRALVRVAACMRRHGYPRWPDPNQRGEFHVRSADAGTQAKMNQAVSACSSLFPTSGWHLTVTPSGQ